MLEIDNRNAISLEPRSLNEEGFREDDLREWILQHPRQFFGEDLLVLGREVGVQGIGDGIDVLAVDRDGNLVVIELKRGALRGDVDFQILKYVSYISRWEYNQIKKQFEVFAKSKHGRELFGDEPDFNETLEEFCNEDYELNDEQRLILAGASVQERIGSVALWLREQGIDVNIIKFTLYRDNDGDSFFLDTRTIVPTSNLEKFEIGDDSAVEPWKEDGRAWHLGERMGPETATLAEQIVGALQEVDQLGDPSWAQKFYIALRIDGINRVVLITRKNLIRLELRNFPIDELDARSIAEQLEVAEDRVVIDSELRHENPGIRIDCYPEDELGVESLAMFVDELVKAQETG